MREIERWGERQTDRNQENLNLNLFSKNCDKVGRERQIDRDRDRDRQADRQRQRLAEIAS